MKHIVVVTTSFPDTDSGSAAAGSFVHDFVLCLSKFLRVTVVAPANRSITESQGNLQIRRFHSRKLPLSLLQPQNPADWLAIASTLRAGQHATLKAVADTPTDYILALWALPCGEWARVAAKKYKINYGLWALGSDIWSLKKIPLVRRYLIRAIQHANQRYADGLKLAGDVTELSGATCNFLPSTRSFPINKHRVFRNAPPYRLVFLGRWHPNKGVDLLLDALTDLSDQKWNLVEEVRIAGGGPMQYTISSRIDELIRCKRPVKQLGYLDKANASELLQWGDYLLLPSRLESIPVIFSDAAKARIPIISTPVGDLPRLLDNYQMGICADTTSVIDFSTAIARALKSPPSAFSSGLKQASEDFNLSTIVRQILQASAA